MDSALSSVNCQHMHYQFNDVNWHLVLIYTPSGHVRMNKMVQFLQRTKDLETAELLEQLPSLQQLLYRLLGCQVMSASCSIYL